MQNVHTVQVVQDSSTSPTRRELNKVATREALVEAALVLSDEVNLDLVTADAVAARAGVSRRTFFNYFASVEDCVASSITSVLQAAIDQFEDAPPDQPVMTAASHAFSQVFTAESTPRMAQVLSLVRTHPRMLRSHLEQWDRATDEIALALSRRFPDTDPLWVGALASSMVSVAASAIRRWLVDLDDAPSSPPALTAAESSQALRLTVDRCFGYLADGFSTPPPAP